MAAQNIYIQVDFKSENANAAITELNKNIASIAPAATQATTQASSGVNSLTLSIQQVSSEVMSFGNILAGIATGAMAKFIVGMVTIGDELNRVEIGLTSLNGSTAKTAALMEQVRVIAKTSPFTVLQLATAAQQMEAFHFKASEIPATLKAISNAMGALGKDAATMDSVISVLGSAMSRDKIPAMQLYRRLEPLGVVDINEMLTKQLKQEGHGTFTPQQISELLRGTSDIGLLSGRGFVEGFIQALKEKKDVGPEMQALVTTNWKNVVDEFNKLIQKLEKDLAPALNQVLGISMKILETFEAMPPWLDKLIWLAGEFGKHWLGIAGIIDIVKAGWHFIQDAANDVNESKGVTAARRWVDQKTEQAKNSWLGQQVHDYLFNPPPPAAPKAPGVPNVPSPHIPLIEPNEEKIKSQIEAAQALLDKAREHEYEGIAAIEIKYAELYKKNAGNTVALHTLRLAMAQEEANKVTEYQDKTTEEHIKNERARLEAAASYSDKMARRQAEIEAAHSTSTLEQAAKVTAAVTAIEDAGALARAKYEQQLAAEVFQKDFAKRQKDLIAAANNGAMIDAVMAGIKVDSQKERDARVAAEQKADEEIARRRADLFKGVAKETTEYETNLRNDTRQEELSQITRAATLAKGAVKTGEDQNAAARIATIQQIAAIEIAAAQQVAVKQKDFIEDDYQTQLRADKIKIDSLKEGSAERARMIDDVAQLEVAAANDVAKKKQIITNDEIANEIKIREDAYRQANEKFIEEQKQVYDKLKSALGTVFDALFEKGKSMWQSLADAAKKALLGMLKEIVTSNVAASMMQMFTGEQVTMESRGGFGHGPLGKLAGVFTQHPVFHPLDHKTGLPPIVTVQPPPGTEGLPVYVVNPTGGQEARKITQEIHERRDVNVNVTGAGASSPGIAAVVAAAAGGAGGGGASGSGGGYSTSSTISYEGGGSETFGGVSGGGAGGGFVGGGREGLGGILGGTGGTFGLGSDDYGSLIGAAGMAATGAGGGGAVSQIAGVLGTAKAASAVSKLLGGAGGSAGMLGGLGLAGAALGLKGAYSLGQSTHPILKAAAIPLGAFSGLLAAGSLAALFPSVFVPLLAAGPIGWIAAAGIGAAVGLYGLLHKTDAQKAHDAVQKAYGIDISNQGVLNAIAQAAKKYGDFNVGIMSPEVQQIIHMYTLSQGMNATANLPRPMYSATLAQNSAAGGLQLQPVYSSGQLVASPYSGATTQQWSQGLYVQLNPQQANDLLAGKVIDAMNNNPGTVASANATGLSSGQSLTAQRNALIEPLTVMS